jgi:hypothetical protein
MSKYLVHAASLIALAVGVTAANAQMPRQEHQGRHNQAQTDRQDERSGNRERNVRRGERGGEERRGDARGERRERMSQSGEREMRKDRGERRFNQDRRPKGERSAEDRSERRDRNDRAAERRNDRRDGDRAERRGGGKNKSHLRANITKEKRTVIRERVVRRAPKRYRRNEISFNLSVGTRIPRSYVIYDVPSVFFDLYPEYRDYDYIVVGDLLLIIDPDTREIIDVIEV